MHLRSNRHGTVPTAAEFGRSLVAWLPIAASVAITVTACGGGRGDEPVVPEELVGTYEVDISDAAGTRAISIGADRSFQIKNPGRRPFSTGPITVDDGELVLAPDEFGDCAKRGTYAYRVADSTLTLTALNDPCRGRVNELGRTWTRRSAVPPGIAAERRALERYRMQRNAICKKRTADAEAVNATAASVGEDVALRKGAAVMRTTQADLDKLVVPGRFTAFVDRDRELRTERIRLHDRLAEALEASAPEAGPIGKELTEGNVIPTEQAEDQYFLTHCP